MASLPTLAVEIAFDIAGVPQSIGSSYTALSWTDVTAYVKADPGVTFTRGRPEAGQTAAAGQLTVAFRNDDGRFTPGSNGGAYGAIHTRMPIRVRGTTSTATTYTLWLGFVTDVDWKIDGGKPVVSMSASDIIAAAARTQCGPWLTRRLQALTGKIGYWPLTDTAPNSLSNATTTSVPALIGETARNLVTGGALATVAGNDAATLSFNVVSDVSPDGASEPVFAFTPVAGSGKYLDSRATLPASGDFGVSLWVRPTSTVSSVLVAFKYTGVGVNFAALHTDASGTLTVANAYSSAAYTVTFGTLTDDVWTHLYLECDASETAPATRFRLWVNGSERTGTATGTATVASNTAVEVAIGGDSLTGINDFDGQIGHVAVFSGLDSTRAVFLANKGTGQPSAATRIGEIHYVTTNPTGLSSWITADTAADNTISAQAVNGKTLLAVCEEIADAERGSIVATRDGKLKLLAQRYAIAPAAVTATLSTASDVLTLDNLFGVDDAANVNQVAVTLQPSGWVYTATRSSNPGVENTTLELWTTDQYFARALADGLANADTQTPRAPSLVMSMERLAYAGLADTFLPLDLGETITVTDLPASAPASTLTLQIRAVTHTVTKAGWQVSIDTDPPLKGAVLDDGTRNVLGSTTYLGA